MDRACVSHRWPERSRNYSYLDEKSPSSLSTPSSSFSPPSSSLSPPSSSTCVSQRWPARSRNYNYLDTTTTNTDPLLRSRSRDPSSVIIYQSYCCYVTIVNYHHMDTTTTTTTTDPFFNPRSIFCYCDWFITQQFLPFASTAEIQTNKTICVDYGKGKKILFFRTK